MLLPLLLLACRCGGPPTLQDVSYDKPELRQVGGKFRGQFDDTLPAEISFAVQSDCPRIERAVRTRKNDLVAEVRVWGTGFERVDRVSAAMVSGELADAAFERDADSLVFPVACDRCEVYLGMQAGGRAVACLGPGYSLRIEGGFLIP